jgi:hypothetical protein
LYDYAMAGFIKLFKIPHKTKPGMRLRYYAILFNN